jgi:hypothetical protein
MDVPLTIKHIHNPDLNPSMYLLYIQGWRRNCGTWDVGLCGTAGRACVTSNISEVTGYLVLNSDSEGVSV